MRKRPEPTRRTRALVLARRPVGRLVPDDFACCDVARTPAPLALEPVYVSVDPYMRTRMQPEGYDYIQRWRAGDVLSGWTLARVVTSRDGRWQPGDWAIGHLPMRECIDHDGAGLIRRAGTEAAPKAYLHPLGMTGFTAWLGMCRLGLPTARDTVLVSAAAGAVGSLAAQWARRAGAQVIATAGRADKRHWLRRIGFKTVLDHRAAAFPEHLARAAGSGLTLNYENVGGTVLAAANGCMRRDGRIVLCGLVSQYEQAAARAAPANMGHLQRLGVRILPFIASDHLADWTHFQQSMGRVLGSLSWRLDVRRGGLEAVPDALVGVLRGDNLGKRVVYFG